MVFSRLLVENQIKTKRVESSLVTCLDESSILSDSTIKRNRIAILDTNKCNKFYLIALCCLKAVVRQAQHVAFTGWE